ncbi:uncharacterized protein LOC142319753 isoform X2 [Lycorma delicatula]|uniref:uncharacterized protein LOC142319753 isoform X2 n=1 Tax=Lycorma delicatula TaxID=130591 RepID=UPI003F514366
MDEQLDAELVARAINFHGQPLQKIWESERGEGDLQKSNVDLDFGVYAQRQKHLNFQDRGKRLKLHQFIAKKANVLFDPELNEREERPPTRSNEPGLYAVLPPYDSFLNIDKASRVKHFFQCVKVGDIIYASIIQKLSSALVLKVLCLDGETARSVADLNIKAHCLTMNLIPAVDKKNISRPFLINDLVCCEVLEVVADSEKMTCGMKGVHTSEHRARLGLVHSDDFPESYKQAQEYSKGEQYNELLENSVGFNNPSNINCLSNTLGLGMNNFTYMNGMRDRFPEGEYASELRQVQASKWAFRSVAEGIDHFKAGRQTEAFQCLNKALNIDPRNIEGLVARGALYANSGNFKKAIEDFESALKLNPNHQNARRYLGETLVAYGRSFEDLNKMDEALKAYERCLTIVPYHEEAQNSIDYIKSKQTNGSSKIMEGDLTIPGLTPSKAQGVKDTLKQLIGDTAVKEDSKKKKKEKNDSHSIEVDCNLTSIRRHHRSSSTSSSSSSASSSSSSSSSSSDSSSASSQDSHHKKKHKRKSEHKDRSLSPLSKRMAMMEDSTAENEGAPGSGSQRGGSHYNPPSMPFSFTGEPQQNPSQPAYTQAQSGKQEKESEYEQRVRKFLEQTKGDLDYEEKVRKFLDETAKWKKERKAMEEKAKKKKKKEKKARSKNKKKKREEKRKKKALKELQEKKLREVLRREKQRRRGSSSHLEEEEEYIFTDKSDLRMLSMGSLNELEDLQSKLTAYYTKVEKGAPLPKKKENSSEKSLGSIAGVSKNKPSPKSMYDDDDDLKREDDSPPPNRNTWDSVAEKKRLDMFADSPTRHSDTKINITQAAESQSNVPSKFKMQIGNVSNRLKKKDKSEEAKEPWDEVEDTRFIYVKEEGTESNEDLLPKKTPDIKKKELEESVPKRPALLDKLGGFRINPIVSEKKKELSPETKPLKRKLRPRTSDTDSSDSDPEPRRNLKKDQDRSPDSSRSRSRSRSRKKYSSESPKKYSSESRSSSYHKERSRSKSGSYRSRSRRYRSSESGSYRSRSYSRSRSRSRSGDYYRRSRSRSDDRHHYRNKYQGRYPRNRGTYYRPRFQNYKSPRGGGNYVPRGHRSRGYNNRGGNRGYVPRMRGRGRPRYFHYKPQDRRDYRRYDRGISRSDDDDMSPMRKVGAAKEQIDKLIAEEKRHTGPLSEGEERDDEYIDRKEYDGKWASKDSEGQRMSSPTNEDDVDKFLNKVKSQKK